VGGGNIAGEIPLLSSFLYLLGKAKRVRRSLTRRRLSRYSRTKGTEWRFERRAGVGLARAVRAVRAAVVRVRRLVRQFTSSLIRFEDTARRGV
jgi:hypothetical protein